MTIDKQSIKVNLEPNGVEGVGLVSFLSFNNPDLLKGLNAAFALKPYEKITGIEITNDGIRAHFKFKK